MVKSKVRGGRTSGKIIGIMVLAILLLTIEVRGIGNGPLPEGSACINCTNIHVSTSPPGLIPQPTGGGLYFYERTATVIAQYVTGYTFQRWTENESTVSTDYSYAFTVNSERSLVAEYSKNQYNISVSTSPSGLNPQPAGEGIYYYNDTATVTAQPVAGYMFQRWAEYSTDTIVRYLSTVSTSASYSFNVTENRTLIAEYTFVPTPTPYTVSVSTSPSGLDPQPAGGGVYDNGTKATVTAQFVTGYTFQGWTENGKQVSTDASYLFTVIGNRSLMAEYSQNHYNISVSTSPPGLNPQPTGGGIYYFNDTATVTAQSVTGYTFQKWTENGTLVSTDASYKFTVTGDRNLVAEYLRSPYNISVSTSPSGLAPQPTGGGAYSYNDTAKVIAQPVTGYTFQRWTENGVLVSTDASYSFNVTGNRTLMAEYSKKTYTVSVTTSPVGLDPQPAGGGNYSFEDAVTVTAQPAAGYTFQGWTENGKQVSTDLRYSFKSTGNRNLAAEYSKAAGPSITVGPSPGVKGTEIIAGETKISSPPATRFDIILKPPILGLIIAMFAIIAAAGILKYLVIGAPKLKVDVKKLLQINIETSGGEILDKPELRQYKVNVDVKGGIEKL